MPEPKRFFRVLDSKRYIITSAQNNTDAHGLFFQTLKVAAAHLKAELVVIPYRYKNPTSLAESRKTDAYWWDPLVVPYLHNVRKKLNPNLVLAADVKIQPTASSPLTGFESLTGAESCIIGAPKMQLRSVPVPSGRYPKILSTTGACTVHDYSDTKAGKIGAFHHYLGALMVEIKGKHFWIRQLNADRIDGSFIDLDKHYTAAGVTAAPPALALVMGDTHERVHDPEVDRAKFGSGGIVETLNPEKLIWHDLSDGETVNPHEKDDPFIAEAKRKAGKANVEAEVRDAVEFLKARSKGRQSVIVHSNHNDFLRRWAVRSDFRHVGGNAGFLLKTQLMMWESAKREPNGPTYADPFVFWVKEMGGGDNVRCLSPNESLVIGGNECGNHGDRGPNGAKGSLKNFSRLGSKTVVAHTHSPGIEEGATMVGTSSYRRLQYQQGPSSHQNADCVIYANGKRALIFIIGTEWRGV